MSVLALQKDISVHRLYLASITRQPETNSFPMESYFLSYGTCEKGQITLQRNLLQQCSLINWNHRCEGVGRYNLIIVHRSVCGILYCVFLNCNWAPASLLALCTWTINAVKSGGSQYCSTLHFLNRFIYVAYILYSCGPQLLYTANSF